MTNLQKFKKLLSFTKEKTFEWDETSLFIKNKEVYYASWWSNGHNGNIEDYTERKAKEKDIPHWVIDRLEEKAYMIYKLNEKERILKELVYVS